MTSGHRAGARPLARIGANLLAVLATLVAPAASAFGGLGHDIVAEIAARRIAPSTRIEVERLLGDRASNAMREGANWPDQLRESRRFGSTGPLHYVNMPPGTCEYRASRDCRDGRCAVGALEHYAARLGKRGLADAERAEALKWVLHLVADLHQPMHAGRAADRGGNDVQLRWFGRGTNLHQLWDSGMLEESARVHGERRRGVAYAEFLDEAGRPEGDLAWSAAAPARWAAESCTLADAAYPVHNAPGEDYLRRMLPVLDLRLRLAGWRLAELLDRALAPQSR